MDQSSPRQLSKECIEAINNKAIDLAIESANGLDYNSNTKHFIKKGMLEVIGNPSVYSKAGLISLEDALGFAEWARLDGWNIGVNDKLWRHYMRPLSDKGITTAQLFQIYQEQKEKYG